MSVVAEDSPAQPDYVWCPNVFSEHFLIGGAIHARVALLDLAEQTFLGGEHGAASVDVDRSAF